MLPKPIPDKLAGAVCAQFVRCGKPNCKCVLGKLHGPYWYRFWRDRKGKQHKEYVRQVDLEAVQAACEAARQEELRLRQLLAHGPRAVKWLTGGPIRWPADMEKYLALEVHFQRTIEELAELVLDHGRKPRQQIRAFAILTPFYLRYFYEAKAQDTITWPDTLRLL